MLGTGTNQGQGGHSLANQGHCLHPVDSGFEESKLNIVYSCAILKRVREKVSSSHGNLYTIIMANKTEKM